jgi:hypothetical protein
MMILSLAQLRALAQDAPVRSERVPTASREPATLNSSAAPIHAPVQTAGVLPLNLDIELGGPGGLTFPGTMTRCVRFAMYKCDGSSPLEFTEYITFTNGQAMGVTISAPTTDTAFECITVRDPYHSLSSTDDGLTFEPFQTK